MRHVSKLSAKGQITILGDLRKAVGIEPADFIAYELEVRTIKLKRSIHSMQPTMQRLQRHLKSGVVLRMKGPSMICNRPSVSELKRPGNRWYRAPSLQGVWQHRFAGPGP
jgi:bifunctional DNA-binding transcriptional regulator/antitoxin component of YhaV-PrlF toxin-antitoxin module